MQVEYLVPFVLILIQGYMSFLFLQSCSQFKDTLKGQHQLLLDAFVFPGRVWKDTIERESIMKNPERLDEIRLNKETVVKKSDFVLAQLQEHSSFSSSFKEVVTSINNYLYSNQGAQPDYQLIKDICDRSIETNESEMLEYIPAPLYVGLVGAMVGVIISLWGLDLDALQDDFGAISPMLISIQLALTVSAIGLVLTTAFSVGLSKQARSKVNRDKFSFLTFIQTELLPVMSQADMSGIQSLSSNLNSFNRNAKEYVARLGDSIEQGAEIVEQETRIVETIKDMDVRTIANQNVHVLKELNEVMQTFDRFKGYYRAFTDSLSSMDRISTSLGSFVEKSQYLEATFKLISQTAQDNHGMYNYFQEHFRQIEDYKKMYGELIGSTSSSIRKHTEELVKFSEERSADEKEQIATVAKSLSESLSALAVKVESVTKKGIEEIELAYKNSQPKFELLEHLEKLESIKEGLNGNEVVERLDRLELILKDSSNKEDINEKYLAEVISNAIEQGYRSIPEKHKPLATTGKSKPIDQIQKPKRPWYMRFGFSSGNKKSKE